MYRILCDYNSYLTFSRSHNENDNNTLSRENIKCDIEP